MTTLLELKEKLVRFYGKYEVYITPIVKFIVAFAALMTIDRNIGYMELVSSTPVALILGLLCAILPVGGTIFIAAVVILADMYALSIEVCLVALLLFVLIYFIYFRLLPDREGRIADADLLPAEYPVCDSGWNGTAGGGIFCICSDLRYGGLLFPRRSPAE